MKKICTDITTVFCLSEAEVFDLKCMIVKFHIYSRSAAYFHTLIAPSLLLDINSLWLSFADEMESIASRWHPAESVAATVWIAFMLNLFPPGPLVISF